MPLDIGGNRITSQLLAALPNPGIVTSGLIVYLDAGNIASYPGSGTTWYDLSGNNNHFTLYNTPTFSTNYFNFDGTNDYASSASLNLTSYSSVTVDVWLKASAGVNGMVWEHTADWNSNPGAIGLAQYSTGAGYSLNESHTNHNTYSPRNYNQTNGTIWHTETNIFSRVSDSTGRLTYINGATKSFNSTYGTGTATTGSESFANSTLYIGARGGSSSVWTGQMGVFLIYGRKLAAAEIQQNFNALRGRYGI